ncbi:MAG: peptide chain release factor N(5)-glutamine methyltransferase [Acidimicrobiia bacterium]|jgi:release factor glutamine methyltransferase
MIAPEALLAASDLPRHEAERLLQAVTGRSRVALLTGEVSDEEAAAFERLAAARRGGEPLQYLEGTVQFGPLELAADRRALIPRPETEQLWELAAAALDGIAAPVVVDLCTGSGNLALALQFAVPDARVYATDVSAAALELAGENASRTGLSGVRFFHGDLFAPLPDRLRGAVDLVVANPPYLAAAEYGALPPDVRDHEPAGALVAGPEGDEVLARIAAAAGEWLRPGGTVMCEISEFRPRRARELFAAFRPEIRDDLAGRPRFVIGMLPSQRRAATSFGDDSGSRSEETT